MRKILCFLFPTVFDRSVSVGLHPVRQEKETWKESHLAAQHGFVRLMKFSGEEILFGLVLDKPHYLKGIDSDVLIDMFRQLKVMSNNMQSHPLEVDLRIGKIRRVYEVGNIVPVLEQRV